MWQFLIFNIFWFAFIFLSPFSDKKIWKGLSIGSIIALSIYSAVGTNIDPYAWLNYCVFSILIFYTGAQFKKWAWATSRSLDEEIQILQKRFERISAKEEEKQKIKERLSAKATEITHIFEKIKEMSKSLDMIETFVVFSEAVSKYFRFDKIQLALLSEDGLSPDAMELFQLDYEKFSALFDPADILKDMAKIKVLPTTFEKKIFETAIREKKAFELWGNESEKDQHGFKLWPDFKPFLIKPVGVQDRLFAFLIIHGVSEKDLPVLSILLERFISEMQRIKLYERIQTLAITDGLTGVYVRRHLLERLLGEIERCDRFALKLSFLMIDIDYFKKFNDQHGHLVGDVVLQKTAETIKKNIRELDLVGRYGGEEFGVLLVETDESGAFYAAERIRKAVAESEYTAYGEKLKVTVSIGCSTYSKSLHPDMNALIDSADVALYQAKHQGRNRVAISDSNL